MMKKQFIPRTILALSLLGIYLATLAPDITWANNGADGGDLVAAAATNGVAHPSGYPTYLLLARLFQFIPYGSPAFRANLMSALIAVCAALALYEIVNRRHGWLAALVSAYAFGLSPLFWSQAVIAEVYTLHVLFVAVFLYLAIEDSRHFLSGLVFGLALGNHLTTILLLPLLFYKDKPKLLRSLSGAALGLTVYLALPLRAMTHPPVNWGNPVTLENFAWLVSGKLYQGQLFALAPAAVWEKAQAALTLLLEQFGILGVLLGFIGLIAGFERTRLNFGLIWIASAFFIFPFAYDTRDSFTYILPAFLCFAIWIGAGLDNLMIKVPARRWSPAIALIFLTVVLIRAGGQWSRVDASRDFRAKDFGMGIMADAPQNSIILAEGDQATLTLWYFHYALEQRPDIAVIANDLLQNEWYQGTLRHNYPSLKLPDDFFMFPEEIVARNLERPICRIERDLALECEYP